jgi:hypothetical protein
MELCLWRERLHKLRRLLSDATGAMVRQHACRAGGRLCALCWHAGACACRRLAAMLPRERPGRLAASLHKGAQRRTMRQEERGCGGAACAEHCARACAHAVVVVVAQRGRQLVSARGTGGPRGGGAVAAGAAGLGRGLTRAANLVELRGRRRCQRRWLRAADNGVGQRGCRAVRRVRLPLAPGLASGRCPCAADVCASGADRKLAGSMHHGSSVGTASERV